MKIQKPVEMDAVTRGYVQELRANALHICEEIKRIEAEKSSGKEFAGITFKIARPFNPKRRKK